MNPHHPDPAAPVEVLPCDREAVAEYVASAFGEKYRQPVLKDGRWPQLVQAFARHRLTHSTRLAGEELRARASMAEEAIGLARWHWREREPLTEHAYQEIVATIRALLVREGNS